MTVLSELLSEAGLPANLFEMMLRDERRDRVPMRPSLRLLGITLRMVRLVVQTGRLTDGQARPLRRRGAAGSNRSERAIGRQCRYPGC